MTAPRHPQRRDRRSVPITGTRRFPVLPPELELDPDSGIDACFESELIHAMDEYCARVATPAYDAAAIVRRTARRRGAFIAASTATAIMVIGTGSAVALNHTGGAIAPSASATTSSYKSPVSSPSAASAEVTVPHLVGLSEQDFWAHPGLRIAITGSVSSTAPRGTVVFQSLAAGTIVARDSVISVWLSLGPVEDNYASATTPPVTVPQVVGRSAQDALATLHQLGLKTVTVNAPSTKVPRGTVISQKCAAGIVVPRGTPILLFIAIP